MRKVNTVAGVSQVNNYNHFDASVLNALARVATKFLTEARNDTDLSVRYGDTDDVNALRDRYASCPHLKDLVAGIFELDTEVRDHIFAALEAAVGREVLEDTGLVVFNRSPLLQQLHDLTRTSKRH